jgi:FdrA protein
MRGSAVIAEVRIRRGEYHDSVRLMQVSRALLDVPGVDDALVAMATDLNLGLLEDLGFDLDPLGDTDVNDLLVAVRATDETALEAATRALDEGLAPPVVDASGPMAPLPLHTIESVARSIGANLALVSVPGPHAFVEAMAALHRGLHVMVFSDNVPVDQEVLLKQEASERALLVMGPDCGTAIVNGVGLGFANAVQSGPVGIAGASGTGIQQVSCLLDDAGVGVRHALGTGSRDLSVEVGGVSTLQALAALDADPTVEIIVVISKPPAPQVAVRVREAATACATPVVLAFLGEEGVTLEGAANDVLAHLGRGTVPPLSWPSPIGRLARPGTLRGLFSGGTLRDEARSIASARLGPVAIDPQADGHGLVDLGGDEFTQGRAHPMIDQRLLIDHIDEAATDSATGVILLDVVLGYGAHPDPASGLAPAITDAVERGIGVVVSLCGCSGDPQDRSRQAETLQQTGASVWASNAAAARYAVSLVDGGER